MLGQEKKLTASRLVDISPYRNQKARFDKRSAIRRKAEVEKLFQRWSVLDVSTARVAEAMAADP